MSHHIERKCVRHPYVLFPVRNCTPERQREDARVRNEWCRPEERFAVILVILANTAMRKTNALPKNAFDPVITHPGTMEGWGVAI